MDDKGRLKIPSAHRRFMDENYGRDFYVTSVTGDCARIYPMEVWAEVERKLKEKGTMDLSVRKFLDRTNFYGQTAEMDAQGRILIHPAVRSQAELNGDVAVMGVLTFLEVWSAEKFRASRIDNQPFTDQDAAAIASLGI